MDHDQISVIVPVYNAERYVVSAVESILAEGFSALEIVLVDDGSTDSTVAKASVYPGVTVITQQRRGPSAARNRGIRESRGTILAFLDADDKWHGGRLSKQLPVLGAATGPVAVSGAVAEFVDCDPAPSALRPPVTRPGYLFGGMMIRKRDFMSVGLLDEDLRAGEFIDWYIRACRKGIAWVMLPDIVLLRRLHSTSVTARMDGDIRDDYIRVLEKHIRCGNRASD